MQLLKDVYLLAGASFGTLGNVYAVRSPEGLVLIDCGAAGKAEPVIAESLSYWGLDRLPITHVLLTHGHWDHAGCAAYFQKKGAKIVCSKGDKGSVEAGGFHDNYPFLSFRYPPCIPDIVVDSDLQINVSGYLVDVILVPGHTPGSVFYSFDLEGHKIFFTGDTVGADGFFGELANYGWKGDPDYDRETYIKSIAKVWKMEPYAVFSGHGLFRMRGAGGTLLAVYEKLLLERA